MALFQPVYAASVDSMESRKRKGNNELTCRGVPLPYLIRPRKKLPLYDSFTLYNEYLEYSSINDGLDSESDDGDSPMEVVETSSLEKGNCFGLENESNASLAEMGVSSGHSLNDEKDLDEKGNCFGLQNESNVYHQVIRQMKSLEKVEALPKSKTERAGAIQMMELSKDAVDESGSEDEGSNSDDWVVV